MPFKPPWALCALILPNASSGRRPTEQATMNTTDDRHPTQAVPVAPPPDVPRVVARPTERSGAAALIWELLQTAVLTIAIFLAVRAVVQNFRVEGASMEPTFETGEYLLINKAAYFHVDGTALSSLPGKMEGSLKYPFGGPQRGDIVVFQAPIQPDKDFIKRVIGLPGESVLIKGGQVLINGQALNEPYLRYVENYTYPSNGQPFVIPDRNYFVLGDNRPNSSDSHLGWTVPVENLAGRGWITYWPPTDWGFQNSGGTP